MRSWMLMVVALGVARVATAGAMQAGPDSAASPHAYWVPAERLTGPTVVLLEPLADRSPERLAATRAVAARYGFTVITDDPDGATQVWFSLERLVMVRERLVRGYLILEPGHRPIVIARYLPDELLSALLMPAWQRPVRDLKQWSA